MAVGDILARIDSTVANAAPGTLNDVLRLHDQLIDLVRALESAWNDNLMVRYIQGAVGEFDVIYALGAETRGDTEALTETELRAFEDARWQLRSEITEAKAFVVGEPPPASLRARPLVARLHDDELKGPIRELVQAAREGLAAYGWRVDVEQTGERLSLEFRNPLSPAILGFGLAPNEDAANMRRLLDFLETEDEFVATKVAKPPGRQRALMGAIRGGAGSYGWSDTLYRQVAELLFEAHVIWREEFDWLLAAGPATMPRPKP